MPCKKRKFRQIITKLTTSIVVLTTILGSLTALFVFPVPTAEAAVTERTAAVEVLTAGQTVKASSSYTALFGFGLAVDAGEKLTGSICR